MLNYYKVVVSGPIEAPDEKSALQLFQESIGSCGCCSPKVREKVEIEKCSMPSERRRMKAMEYDCMDLKAELKSYFVKIESIVEAENEDDAQDKFWEYDEVLDESSIVTLNQ